MKKILLLGFLFISLAGFSQLPTVNIGVYANDHTGDPLRTAFIKLNEAIDELNRIGVTRDLTTPEERNILHNWPINTVNIRDITTIPTIYTAVGDTSNYPVPNKLGDFFFDTADSSSYYSISAARGGWIKIKRD
jgi:hypothetical protein